MKRSGLLALLLCGGLIVSPVPAAEPLPTGKVDGIYYEVKGTGPAVVLLHGGQMDRRMWDVARKHVDLSVRHVNRERLGEQQRVRLLGPRGVADCRHRLCRGGDSCCRDARARKHQPPSRDHRGAGRRLRVRSGPQLRHGKPSSADDVRIRSADSRSGRSRCPIDVDGDHCWQRRRRLRRAGAARAAARYTRRRVGHCSVSCWTKGAFAPGVEGCGRSR